MVAVFVKSGPLSVIWAIAAKWLMAALQRSSLTWQAQGPTLTCNEASDVTVSLGID